MECKPKFQTGKRGEAVFINCTTFGYPLPSQIHVKLPNGTNTSFSVKPGKMYSKQEFELTVNIGQSAEGGGLYVIHGVSSADQVVSVSSILGMSSACACVPLHETRRLIF